MRQRCEWCGGWIDDTDEVCPNCGGANDHMMASGEGVPKTISELREFAEKHNLPLRQMRFFIGEDFKEPKAFGIYEDGRDFVVYKNKANGERAVRYRGHDEAYAVNEIYQKMKSEVANQRRHIAGKRTEQAHEEMRKAQRKSRRAKVIAGGGIVALIVAGVMALASLPGQGYYSYDDTTYYYQGDDWYYYDTSSSSWEREDDPPQELTDHNQDYWQGDSWDTSTGATDFADSEWYVEPSTSSDDDDSDWGTDWDDDDWSWDSGDSWDSGYTDWDSDW